MAEEIAVGIDLGTTNSAIAYVGAADRVEVVVNDFGKRIMPSVVQFPEPGRIVVGWEAKQQIPLYPQQTAQFFKRDMGTSMVMTFAGQRWTPTTLSAEVLKKLKADAEAYLGKPVRKAVVTVPAYFLDPQRRDTEEAARLAGFDVLKILNEPAAVALAYGMERVQAEEKVLIYDLGGGTFDVTVAQVRPGDIKIIGQDGNARLGGKDWDDLLLQAVCEEFEEKHDLNPLDDVAAFQEWLMRVEDLKKSLTAVTKGTLVVSYAGIRERIEITRERFEELTKALMLETDSVITRLLDALHMKAGDINRVILAGGSSRMPMVLEQIRSRFGSTPMSSVNPDECVAQGAAIQAHILANRDPGSRKRIGAGADSGGGRVLAQLSDVSAHSLGMIVISSDESRYENSIILKKNTPVPAEVSEIKQLQTVPDRDNIWDVYLLQGDSIVPTQNEVLGKFTFHNIPHYDGITRVRVVYRYDESAITRVSGIDEKSGHTLGDPDFSPPPQDITWTLMSPEEHRKQVATPNIEAVLCIDVSGSMEGSRISEAKKGAKKFNKLLGDVNGRVALVTFNSVGVLKLTLTQPGREMEKAIDALKADDGTNIAAGLRIARDQLIGSERSIPGSAKSGIRALGNLISKQAAGYSSRPVRRIVIVLSDGETSDEAGAVSLAKEMHAQGIEIGAIGTGEANQRFLDEIASSADLSLFVAAKDLSDAFGTIAKNLTQQGLRK